MDTVQIEVTNACQNRCANCTRFVGHTKPFFLKFDKFQEAVDSMIDYPKMTGVMGGEPLLHPDFEKFCKYIRQKIPRRQLGLWTALPPGYEHHREVIAETFGNIFVNDHTRNDVWHHPFLVGIEEVYTNRNEMYTVINRCFFQEVWSASINPNGAFFCEIAAAMSMIFRDASRGWKVTRDWWWKTPKDFREQIEKWCPRCGGALMLKRRVSVDDGIDDISPKNLERLKGVSYKVNTKKYELHSLKEIECDKQEPMASYKELGYRNRIAYRYGMYLTDNEDGFNEPHLLTKYHRRESLVEKFKEMYG